MRVLGSTNMTKRLNQDALQKHKQAIIGCIYRAAEKGKWDGFDGAGQYLSSEMLKSYSKKFGKEFKDDLLVCAFREIAKVVEKKFVGDVAIGFIKNYSEVVVKMAQSDPNFFHAFPEVKRYCEQNLAPRRKKLFLQAIRGELEVSGESNESTADSAAAA
jgi:hypothetical protein